MKVVILKVDNWEALYIDGEKVEENHSLNTCFVLEAIEKAFEKDDDFSFESYMNESTEEAWYPEKLKDVDPELRGDISL